MHDYHRVVRLADTDATGVIYFSNVQQICMESFEDFLDTFGVRLSKMLEQGPVHLPVVHVEADYLAPMKAGDHLKVEMRLSKIGTTSFSFKYNIFCKEEGLVIATLLITHVVLDRETKKPTTVPQDLLVILERAK